MYVGVDLNCWSTTGPKLSARHSHATSRSAKLEASI